MLIIFNFVAANPIIISHKSPLSTIILQALIHNLKATHLEGNTKL